MHLTQGLNCCISGFTNSRHPLCATIILTKHKCHAPSYASHAYQSKVSQGDFVYIHQQQTHETWCRKWFLLSPKQCWTIYSWRKAAFWLYGNILGLRCQMSSIRRYCARHVVEQLPHHEATPQPILALEKNHHRQLYDGCMDKKSSESNYALAQSSKQTTILESFVTVTQYKKGSWRYCKLPKP